MIALIEICTTIERWMPVPVKIGLARLLGLVAFWLFPRIRRNTIANMSVMLGLPASHPRVRALALRSVQAYAEHLADFLRMYRLTAAELLRQTVHIEGYENFRRFQSMGLGGVLISAHFGNFEWCGGLVSLDSPTYAVAETFSSRSLTALLDHVRAKKNMQSLQLGGAARGILRVLRRAEFVAIVADRPTPGKGVQVEFFGRPTWVPEGAAALARRAGSPLLVGGMTRNHDRTFNAYGMPPIFVDRDKPAPEAVREAMQHVMWDLETLIRKAPAQWYMFRPMWPEAAAELAGRV